MPCGPQGTLHHPQTGVHTLSNTLLDMYSQNTELGVPGWTCCVVRGRTYFPPCHSSPHSKHRRLRNFSFLDRHSVNLGPEEEGCATSLPVGAQRAEICSTRTCTRAHTRARTHMPCGPQDTAHRPQTRKRTLKTAPCNSTAQNVQVCVSVWTCCVPLDTTVPPGNDLEFELFTSDPR